MGEAELAGCLAKAGTALSKAHPLFSAPCAAEHLAHQARKQAALAAPNSWSWTHLELPETARVSPDASKAADCKDNQLLLWSLTGLQPVTAVVDLPPGFGYGVCKWSENSDFVGCQGNSSVFIVYQLSTSRMHSTTLQSSSTNGEQQQPQQEPPCLASFMGYVPCPGVPNSHCLCLVSLQADGQLCSQACPAKFCSTNRDGYDTSTSISGCKAFSEDYSTLCLWQPGVELLRVKLCVTRLCWSPDGKTLLVDRRHSISFVSRQGVVLAKQELYFNEAPFWGPQGVLVEGGSREHRDILFYVVQPGPPIELQHRFQLPSGGWPFSYLALSADHFAFVMGPKESPDNCEQAIRQLCVLETPVARQPGAAMQVTQVGALAPSPELGLCIDESEVRWLSNGNSIQCQRRTSHQDYRMQSVLVNFNVR